jgi:hypothetical protein
MKIIFLIFLSFPFLIYADDISEYEYEYYAKSSSYVAYIKSDDHCIYGGDIEENDIKKYCDMGSSGINLTRDHPSVYAVELHLSVRAVLSFIVAAPWNEQKCKADLYENSITCEPTGR